MARRGRFGNPSGGSNLAITIQNMLRQKKAQEEQLLLQRFRNGQATLAEVQSFYNDWISSAGYSQDSIDYKQIQQSIEDAKNQNLIFRYNDLSATFKETNGANYKEVMDFLNNEAMTSTDAQNRQSFVQEKQNVTNGYIQGAKTRLASGEITVDQFKADLAANFDSAFPPGDESAKTARYDALAAEYDAMISVFNNRIKANLPGSYSGLQSFIKTFQKDLVAYGVNTNSELYTRSQADAVTASSGATAAAATPSVDRANKASDKLGDILAAIQKTGQTNLPGLTLEDIKAGKKYGAAELMSDPGIVAKIVRLVDTGVIAMPQGLIDLGITDTSQLSSTVDTIVRSYSANVVSAAAIDQRYSTAAIGAKALASQVGITTGVDEFRDALGQYTDDIHAAQIRGDDVAMGLAIENWRDYLNRRNSKYGTLPADSALNPAGAGSTGAAILDSIAVSRRAANGEITGSADMPAETLFGIAAQVSGTTVQTFQDAYANGSVAAVMKSYDDLTSGRAVQHVTFDKNNPELGPKYTTESYSPLTAQGVIFGSDVSAKGGLLTVMTLKDLAGGKFAPVMQQIENVGVVQIAQPGQTAAKTWGYIYKMDSGATVYADTSGKFYDGSPFDGNPQPKNGTLLVNTNPSQTSKPMLNPPAFDVQSVLKVAGNGDPSKATFDGIRSVVAAAKKQITDKGLTALIPAGNTVDTMFKQVNDVADSLEMQDINTKAFLLKTGERRGGPTVDTLEYSKLTARANEIANGEGSLPPDKRLSAGSLFNQQVLQNKDKYVEVQPGLWKLKPSAKNPEIAYETNQYLQLLYGGTNTSPKDSFGRPLADTVDLRNPAIKAQQDAAQQRINDNYNKIGQNIINFGTVGVPFESTKPTPSIQPVSTYSPEGLKLPGLGGGLTTPTPTPSPAVISGSTNTAPTRIGGK